MSPLGDKKKETREIAVSGEIALRTLEERNRALNEDSTCNLMRREDLRDIRADLSVHMQSQREINGASELLNDDADLRSFHEIVIGCGVRFGGCRGWAVACGIGWGDGVAAPQDGGVLREWGAN